MALGRGPQELIRDFENLRLRRIGQHDQPRAGAGALTCLDVMAEERQVVGVVFFFTVGGGDPKAVVRLGHHDHCKPRAWGATDRKRQYLLISVTPEAGNRCKAYRFPRSQQ